MSLDRQGLLAAGPTQNTNGLHQTNNHLTSKFCTPEAAVSNSNNSLQAPSAAPCSFQWTTPRATKTFQQKSSYVAQSTNVASNVNALACSVGDNSTIPLSSASPDYNGIQGEPAKPSTILN